MDLYDVLDQIVALLQRRGRVTYNALKLQFSLDDDQLAVLTDELLYAHPQVVEDAGRMGHWVKGKLMGTLSSTYPCCLNASWADYNIKVRVDGTDATIPSLREPTTRSTR